MEGRHIFSQALSAVPLRVDRDEQGLHPVRLCTQIVHELGHFRHGGRADIGTIREAEEDQAELSPEISHGVGLSVSVLQGEVWPEGLLGLLPSTPKLDR